MDLKSKSAYESHGNNQLVVQNNKNPSFYKRFNTLSLSEMQKTSNFNFLGYPSLLCIYFDSILAFI